MVIPADHPELEQFYIGIDELTRHISFYPNSINSSPAFAVDIDGALYCISDTAIQWIPKWLIFLCWKKSRDAILAGEFPSSISFQS